MDDTHAQHKTIASLNDVDTVTLDVEVEDNGDILVFPMRLLTHFEHLEIGYEVPNPVPPIGSIHPTTKQPIPDRNDPTYQMNMQRAEAERNYRRLAASLNIDIPGSTLAEKADALKRSLNANIMRQLLTMMLSKVAEGEARIADRAATFHRNGTGDPAGAGAVRTSDAGSVAGTE
jgi:hypothetical protein